jgi:hypothetical protein
VRILRRMPSRVLIGRKLLLEQTMVLDLHKGSGSFQTNGVTYQRRIVNEPGFTQGTEEVAVITDRPLDTCPCLLPRVPYNTSHVYRTPRVHVFPPLFHGSISRDYTRPHRATSLYTRLCSSHTTHCHPPSHYVLTPHSFYNYIRIRTHHVSNQHVTVISPDHQQAHISCCIVTVISPRNLLCALAEHTEATFSPPTCASIISPIV